MSQNQRPSGEVSNLGRIWPYGSYDPFWEHQNNGVCSEMELYGEHFKVFFSKRNVTPLQLKTERKTTQSLVRGDAFFENHPDFGSYHAKS